MNDIGREAVQDNDNKNDHACSDSLELNQLTSFYKENKSNRVVGAHMGFDISNACQSRYSDENMK